MCSGAEPVAAAEAAEGAKATGEVATAAEAAGSAGAAELGTAAALPTAVTGAGDAIEGLIGLTEAAGTTATPAAASFGFASPEAALAAVNPEWVTAGATAATAASAGGAAKPAGGAITMGTLKDVATVLTPAAAIFSAATTIGASRGQLAGRPTGPAVPAPTPMPIAGSLITGQSLRASLLDQLARKGRASTILTAPASQAGEKLGI